MQGPKKAYYPKNRILTDLYTNTNEFVYKNPKDNLKGSTNGDGFYFGYYWADDEGRYWTGHNPNQGEGKEIIRDDAEDKKNDSEDDILLTKSEIAIGPYPYPWTYSDLDYDKLFEGKMSSSMENPYAYDASMISSYFNAKDIETTSSPKPKSHPKSYHYTPTEKQYQDKHIIRYFSKKTSNNIYTEINEKTYKKFLRKEDEVLWELYQVFQIKWIISGQIEESYTANFNLVRLAEKNNKIQNLGLFLKNKYNQFFLYNEDLSERKYKNGEKIAESLPRVYGYPKQTGINCKNCVFNNNGYCNKWQANIKLWAWCKSWKWIFENQTITSELLEGIDGSNISNVNTQLANLLAQEESAQTSGYNGGQGNNQQQYQGDPQMGDEQKDTDYGEPAGGGEEPPPTDPNQGEEGYP